MWTMSARNLLHEITLKFCPGQLVPLICLRMGICGMSWIYVFVNDIHPPQNLRELGVALQGEWQNIPQHQIQNLVGSMCGHCDGGVQDFGGHTDPSITSGIVIRG